VTLKQLTIAEYWRQVAEVTCTGTGTFSKEVSGVVTVQLLDEVAQLVGN